MRASERLERLGLKLHQALYTRSDGRIGHRLAGVPCLLLRSTGRRSGACRTNALVYARDGADLLVVASNGGADAAPGWLHNLRASPAAEIQIGRERRPVHARIVEGGPERDRLWRIVNANNRGRYDRYQARTARVIPIAVLSPEP